MKATVAVLEPEMRKRGDQREVHGRVILGTVKGDIHEIGKGVVSKSHSLPQRRELVIE